MRKLRLDVELRKGETVTTEEDSPNTVIFSDVEEINLETETTPPAESTPEPEEPAAEPTPEPEEPATEPTPEPEEPATEPINARARI